MLKNLQKEQSMWFSVSESNTSFTLLEEYFGHHIHHVFIPESFDHFGVAFRYKLTFFRWYHNDNTLYSEVISWAFLQHIASHVSLFILLYLTSKNISLNLTNHFPFQTKHGISQLHQRFTTHPPPKPVLLQQQILLPSQSLRQHPHPTTTASPACCLEHSMVSWAQPLATWIIYWLIMVG